tara:strand:+ start:39 stop:1754 length:1716 start_codon:yes stop_codon:yes gene_type:complete
MATDQSIIIKFKSTGSKALTKAVQNLTDAERELRGETAKVRKQGGMLDTTFEKNRKNASALGNAFATLRSKLLLFSFAMGMGVRQTMLMIKEAAKIEDMSRAFLTLQGGGEKASLAIDKLKDATDGTMTQFDLFQQANNAMILGVSQNSDEMAEMFDIAQRLGQALGKDTKLSVESLITGIGRQSRLMLDNIGIIVKADEAYESYADEIGVTVDQLSDQDKKQAFLNATMDSARKKVEQLGEEELSTNAKLKQLGVTINDTSIAFGELLEPLVIPLAQGLELIARGAGNVIKTFGNLGSTLDIDFDSLEGQIDFTSKLLADYKLDLIELGVTFKEVFGQETMKLPDIPDSGIMSLVSAYDQLSAKLFVLKEAQEAAKPEENVQTKLQKHLEFVNKLFDEQSDKAKKASEASTLAAVRAAASYKHAGRAAEEAAQKALIAEAQKFMAQYISSIMEGLPFPVNITVAAGAGAFAGNLFQQFVSQAKTLKFEQGGLVGGRRHSQGGTMIEAEQGEFVMSRSAVEAVGIENMNRINQGGSTGININISAPLVDDTIVDTIIPKIKEAVRRGESLT